MKMKKNLFPCAWPKICDIEGINHGVTNLKVSLDELFALLSRIPWPSSICPYMHSHIDP